MLLNHTCERVSIQLLVRHIKIIMIYHFLFLIFRRVVKYKWQAYGKMDMLTQFQWEHSRLSKKIVEGITKWTHLHYIHKCKCKAKTCKAVHWRLCIWGAGLPDKRVCASAVRSQGGLYFSSCVCAVWIVCSCFNVVTLTYETGCYYAFCKDNSFLESFKIWS